MSSFFSFLPADGWQRLAVRCTVAKHVDFRLGLAYGAISGAPISGPRLVDVNDIDCLRDRTAGEHGRTGQWLDSFNR